VVVFLLYLIVLRYWAASRASYGFVIIPFVTLVLSAWFDNEPVGLGLALGGLLVLAGRRSATCRQTQPSGSECEGLTRGS
jgi:drug/metabolite transporter (DMT)-like permease